MFDKQLGKVSIRSLGQLNLQQPNQVLNSKAHLLKILGCSFIKHLWQYIEIKILVPLFPNSTWSYLRFNLMNQIEPTTNWSWLTQVW